MKKKENIILISYIVLLTIIKISVFSNTPLWIFPDAGHDDELLYKIANSLTNGEWLGSYSSNTLIKGFFFPLFLMINHSLGIPFLTAQTLFFSFACTLFIFACKKMINNNWLLGLMYTFLFFIPASLSRGTFQRAYRSGIVLSQTLIVFASIISLFYLALKKDTIKKWIPWSIALAFSLTSMKYTREDSFWVMPFVIVASTVIYFCSVEKDFIKLNHFYYKHILVLLIPFVFSFGIKTAVSITNYNYYGIYTATDLSGTNFAKCIKLMYSIDDPAEAPRTSVSREKMDKLYDVSTTLSSARDYIDTSLDAWSTDEYSRNVMDGWFYWAFREALSEAGYYESAAKSEDFYGRVCDELQNAIDEGILTTHPTMPSALMSPWREEYKTELWEYVKVSHEVVYTNEGQAIWGEEAISYGDYEKVKERAEYLKGNVVYDLEGNNIEEKSVLDAQNSFVIKANKTAKIGTKLFRVYQKFGSLIYYISIACFIYLIVCCILDLRKHIYNKVPIIVVIVGMGLSYLLVLIGISYTHISAFDAIHTLRLAYAYPVFSAMEMISILVTANDSINYIISRWYIKGRT